MILRKRLNPFVENMTNIEVVDLMKSSESADEWNKNCDKVRASFRGEYPDWWYQTMILSGLLDNCAKKWVANELKTSKL
jgi:hypothetical protein